MWKKLFIVLIIVIVLAGTAIGLYSYFKNFKKGNAYIQSNQEYPIHSMWNALYSTSATGNMVDNPFSSGSIINLDENRFAYCKFGDEYKTFEIHFNGENPFQFVVSYPKVNKNGLSSATIQHIYNGKIHSYYVYTDETYIYITAAVTQTVKVASEDEFGTAYRTIDSNEIVMMFYIEEIT